MRLDFATIIGFIAGIAINVLAIEEGGNPLGMYFDLAAVLIVFGGAFASAAVQFSAKDLMGFPRVLKYAFIEPHLDPNKLIGNLIRYAEIARRDGILALEAVTREEDDEFLITGIQLAVDGTDPELIRSMMETELQYLSRRHERGKRLFEAMMDYCPSWGMIGTVIGLVGMLRGLSNVSAIGPAMALAMLATYYGAVGCYLFFKPVSMKLEFKSHEEILVREMIIRGVMSIQSGDNPRIVSQKLRIFLAPNQRMKLAA